MGNAAASQLDTPNSKYEELRLSIVRNTIISE
jgi:hypothetical protein